MHDSNPFFDLPYESAFEALGNDFYDYVQPACFPKPLLRFRNDDLLPLLGLSPTEVCDRHFVEAFCQFLKRSFTKPLSMALRYPVLQRFMRKPIIRQCCKS
ncbi:MAG: protein adenylyltransferase SelO family protein [Cyanobacteria bacterium P01_D01_bin.105]